MNVEVLEAKKITILNSVFDSAERVAGDIRYSKKTALLKARMRAGSAAIRLLSIGIFRKKVTWMLFDLKFRRV
jgi:hypothetical protein